MKMSQTNILSTYVSTYQYVLGKKLHTGSTEVHGTEDFLQLIKIHTPKQDAMFILRKNAKVEHQNVSMCRPNNWPNNISIMKSSPLCLGRTKIDKALDETR